MRKHVSEENKIKQLSRQPDVAPGWSQTTVINEPCFYEHVFGQWVFKNLLPSIRKYGQYKKFDNPNNHMFIKIENEFDLHS